MYWCFVYSLLHFFGNWLVSIHGFFGLAGSNTSTGWLATASTSVVFNYDWMGGASRSAATGCLPTAVAVYNWGYNFRGAWTWFWFFVWEFLHNLRFLHAVASWFLVALNLSNNDGFGFFLAVVSWAFRCTGNSQKCEYYN